MNKSAGNKGLSRSPLGEAGLAAPNISKEVSYKRRCIMSTIATTTINQWYKEEAWVDAS